MKKVIAIQNHVCILIGMELENTHSAHAAFFARTAPMLRDSDWWEADLDQDENADGSPRTEKSVPVVIAEAMVLDSIRMGKASEAIEKAIADNSGLNVSDSDIADGLTDEAMEILKAHFVSWWA